MTSIEVRCARALSTCSFLPGCFDKRWVKQLPKWQNREMTEKGRALLLKLVQKYRRQIPNHLYLYTNLKGQMGQCKNYAKNV